MNLEPIDCPVPRQDRLGAGGLYSSPWHGKVTICAWHLFPDKDELKRRALARFPDATISHGICPECRARVFEREPHAIAMACARLRVRLGLLKYQVSCEWRAGNWEAVWNYSERARQLRAKLRAVRRGEA